MDQTPTHSPDDPAFDHRRRLTQQLAGLHIRFDSELLQKASDLVAPAPFASMLSSTTAGEALPAVWRQAFNKVPATPAGLLVSLAVREAMTVGEGALGGDLGDGLFYRPTWRFVHVQTAGLLYLYGLGAMGRGQDEVGRAALHQAMECWKEVEAQDHTLKGKTARTWRGMRGVAQLTLARRAPDPLPLLRAADHDMSIAAERGDTSVQHYCLHLEILTRLIDEGDDRAADAYDLIDEAQLAGAASREWLMNRADLVMRLAWQCEPSLEEAEPNPGPADGGRAEEQYALAVELLDRALAVSPAKDAPDTLVLARRGMAKARFAWCLTRRAERSIADGISPSSDIDKVDDALRDALADLREGMAQGAPIQGKALVGILLQVAKRAHRRRDFEDCRAAAEEGEQYSLRQPGAVPDEIRQSLSALGAECRLRAALDVEDADAIRLTLDLLADLPGTINRTATPMIYAARRLLTDQPVSPQDLRRIDTVIDTLHRQILRTSDDGARSFMASHAVTLLVLQLVVPIDFGDVVSIDDQNLSSPVEEPLYSVGGWPSALHRDDPVVRTDLLARIYALATVSVESGQQGDPGWLRSRFMAGRAALRYAKALATSTDGSAAALPLLREATAHFESLVESQTDEEVPDEPSVGFEPVKAPLPPLVENDLWTVDRMTLASLAGEAYLRLHAVTRQLPFANRAIDLLTDARALGNTSIEIAGLLGDAYYRRGRDCGSAEDLHIATRLKAECRDAGHESRENLSVSAAAYQALWEREGDSANFVSAVVCASQACRVDSGWPWPWLQLASFATAPLIAREAIARTPLPVTAIAFQDLLSMIARGDEATLNERAARAAIATREFRQSVLGGRTRTFVLDDPHRLLSTTLVLKPTSEMNARTEQMAIQSLAEYLAVNDAPTWMQVPEVVAVVPVPPDWSGDRGDRPTTSLVTRRAAGVALATLIGVSDSSMGITPEEAAARAVRYLARIHAWRGGPSLIGAQAAVVKLATKLDGAARAIGVTRDLRLGRTWSRECPAVPTVRFRDAHAENWLITSSGDVVALDLESTSRTSILLEVAQLLDDFPLFAADDAGWASRLTLCNIYLSELEAAGHPNQLDSATVAAALTAFTLSRVAFLGAFIPRESRRTKSTGGRRFAHRRLQHAAELATYLADATPIASLQKVAELLAPELNSSATLIRA